MQSMVASGLDASFRVIDPDPAAEQLLLGRLRDSGVSADGDVRFETAMESLPGELDIAIVATRSDVRLSAIERLLTNCRPRFLILEKFLFPKLADYATAEACIGEAGVTAFVNCPRRLFPGYRALKQEAAGPVRFSVTGGNWGLACNSIHFLDLLNFLAPSENYEVRSTLSQPFEAKRSGFVEFFGRIDVSDASGNRLELVCCEKPSGFGIVAEDRSGRRWSIDEVDQSKINDVGQAESFPVPLQSDMTAGVIMDLLNTGACGLTPYCVSMRLHQVLLREFLRTYNAAMDREDNEACLIT